MTDNRIKIANTKPVNLYELDQTLGGHGLNGDENWIMAIEGSPVTFDQLQAAYDAYDSTQIQNLEAKEKRQKAFQDEADPLFFGWQRGENTEQEWLDKVAEIRARYPYA